jgi:diguanylate cyclase (GGDEF)-like protein
LMMDLDGFKHLNDSLGHVAGDRALKVIAEILLSNTRRSDTKPAYEIDIPFRYGGDEFAVIVPNTPAQAATVIEGGPNVIDSAGGAVVVAERLRALIAGTMEKEGLTTSIGVAGYPLHGGDTEDLVIAADTALYRAKRMGGNCVVVARPLKKSSDEQESD